MPCRDDGPHYITVHGDDCKCGSCRNEAREAKRQAALKAKLSPVYTEKFRKGVEKLGLPVLGSIHQEERRWEECIDYEPCGPNQAVDKFKKWLGDCRPFPEGMKFKFLEAFGCAIVITWHHHKKKGTA